jgi:hypothetical protein
MRVRLIEGFATAVMLIVTSCQFPSTKAQTCEDDIELCPESSTTATTVTCDCKCSIGIGDASEKYDGRVAMCLPADLNRTTGNEEQRVALRSIEPRTFDQRVFNYCSQEVARFMRTAIKAQARVRLAACAVPVACECTTEGSRRDSPVCHSPCKEVACDDESCRALVRKDGKLDMSACNCSRASACGASAPEEAVAGLCRDWLTPVVKRP